MRESDVWGLAKLLGHIDHAKAVANTWASSSERDELVPEDTIALFVTGNLLLAQYFAQKMELQSTHDRVWEGGGAFYLIADHLTWQQLSNELTVLRQSIEADLEKHLFVQVGSQEGIRVKRLEVDWGSVWTAIPESKEDIEEATYCYALERNTAAVFHAMRVAEWGLRAFFATALGLRK